MAEGKTIKSAFVAFRAEPQQLRKLRLIAMAAGQPNVSAALRLLVDAAPEPEPEAVLAGQAQWLEPQVSHG